MREFEALLKRTTYTGTTCRLLPIKYWQWWLFMLFLAVGQRGSNLLWMPSMAWWLCSPSRWHSPGWHFKRRHLRRLTRIAIKGLTSLPHHPVCSEIEQLMSLLDPSQHRLLLLVCLAWACAQGKSLWQSFFHMRAAAAAAEVSGNKASGTCICSLGRNSRYPWQQPSVWLV